MRISPHKAIGLLFGAVLLLIAVAIAGVAAVQPGCAGCHLKGSFGTQTARSSHAAVACTRCHAGPDAVRRVDFASKQVGGMYLRLVALDPVVAQVDSGRCRVCHARQLRETTTSNGLTIKHSECAQGRECTDCHSTVAHGTAESWPRTPTMEMCFECHWAKQAPTECDDCHEKRLPADRIKTGTFAVTHGPDHLKTHGMGGMSTCSPCHKPEKCAKCHGPGVPHRSDFVNRHGGPALAKGARCTTCHVKTFCSGCHGVTMPHPLVFLKGHGLSVQRNGQAVCDRCHEATDCTECHEKHVHPLTIEQLQELGIPIPEGFK